MLGATPSDSLGPVRMDAPPLRYALFYLCYFAALGAHAPYIGRYVDARGHGGYVVGAMLAIWYASRVLGPPLWALLLTRSSHPGRWLVGGAVFTLLAFSGFVPARSVPALLLVMALFGLSFNALLPQFEAMTVAALGAGSSRYSRTRLWGSVGFMLAATVFGALLDRLGSLAFAYATLPLMALLVASAWPHRNDRHPEAADSLEQAGHLWRRPGVRRFLVVALLMQISFSAFYVFYTLHLQAAGHSGASIGALWGFGVLVEIALFWSGAPLFARYSVHALMQFCIAVSVLRWLLTALYPQSLALMLAAQTLHAFGFALFHLCSMRRIETFFPGRRAVKGQSLLYGFSSGLGGVIGAGLMALMWEQGGGRAAFLAGAAVAVVALGVLRRGPTLP